MRRNLYYEDELIPRKFNLFMMRRLLSYAKKYSKTYALVMATMVATSFLSLLPAAFNLILINNVLPVKGALQGNYITVAVSVLAIWSSLLIGFLFANYISGYMANRLGYNIIKELRGDLFHRLMELSFDYYDSRPAGKILVRITSYTDEIAIIFINNLTSIIINGLMMLFSIICVFILELRLAIVVLLAGVPLTFIIWLLVREIHKRVTIERSKHSNRTAFIAEDINGLEVIKAFNREELNLSIHDELARQVTGAFAKTTRVREAFFPLSHGIIRCISIILIYSVALLIIQKDAEQTLNLGVLVAVTTYMDMFANSLFQLCQRMQHISTLTSNLERIFDTMDTIPKIQDAPDAMELKDIKGDITFHNVSFGYSLETNVLTDLNLEIKAGEMIALVGPTGAGKTTIVSLLSRFYDVKEGEIQIDGFDIRKVTLKSLREQIGVMMQDTFLFSGEIIENIRFSKPDATDEECMEAAKHVLAHDFIMKLPEGYHTVITSQASELSGGERQLLSFARLVLANPKILILDEATSNIDTETESRLQAMMQRILKGRTSFVIAHRLSTIKNADRILYIEDKNIAECGNHEELMRQKGKYYRLVMGNSQR